MTINLWLTTALVVSAGINGILIWFAREQASRLSTIADNSDDLLEMIRGYLAEIGLVPLASDKYKVTRTAAVDLNTIKLK